MINEYAERNNVSEYVEPFLGAASVSTLVTIPNKHLSDVHEPLMDLWRSVLAGTFNPRRIRDHEYKSIRNNPDLVSPEEYAFYGFACSFGGKYWGGFARNPKGNTDYHQQGMNSLERKRRLLEEYSDTITLTCELYEDAIERHTHRGIPLVIYCDPPYQGTTGYKGTPQFDNERFWDVMRTLSRNQMVFISEYTYPDDFIPVQTFNSRITLDVGNNKATKSEFLLTHESRVGDVMEASLQCPHWIGY